ncbi:MAG: hypothetical protein AB1450_08685 [Pseudomonadota bacterium]
MRSAPAALSMGTLRFAHPTGLMEFTEAVSGGYFFAPSVERLRTL